MQILSLYIENLLKNSLDKKGFYHLKLFTDWQIIVGEQLSKYSTPKSINWQRIDQNSIPILQVAVANGSIATEIYYQEPLIIEKINLYCGYEAVLKLKIIQDPTMMIKIKPKVNSIAANLSARLDSQAQQELIDSTNIIEDHKLRAVFIELGRYIINEQNLN